MQRSNKIERRFIHDFFCIISVESAKRGQRDLKGWQILEGHLSVVF